ncbi:hypothetical protein FDP41_005729 [Naegleria fowleri]|uniref:FAD dependent oxidoreductase domain-containing protein n=1 Tax=Naegleria fowleri TaxID=5763 RepID=A0A6A5BJG9_NAEFO|nr:uncharacterized protein FDP41_005729 [Naegleria fowleri]KAF0974976.1 hypothetical protein FDP41_005729 [Naegleria fowleri]CAG4718648.1 unnamed protein product [Naegleria fowleri]
MSTTILEQSSTLTTPPVIKTTTLLPSSTNVDAASTSLTKKPQERVAIIGAGWYGCHLGVQLKKLGYQVVIFEKNSDIFMGASGFNQFRLHKGLHYPRSYVTRVQSLKGFDHFMEKYSHLTTQVDYNLYAIAKRNSWLDFGTYKQVMDATKIYNKPFNHEHFGLTNLEGSMLCDERVLYHAAPRKFFREQFTEQELLLNNPVKKAEQVTITSFVSPQFEEDDNTSSSPECSDSYEYELKEEQNRFAKIKINDRDDLTFDWCISCTYNTFLVTPSLNIYYEPCISLIYKDIRSDPFPRVAMTICDGHFCSLFPYISGPEEEKRIAQKYANSDLGVLKHHTHGSITNSTSSTTDGQYIIPKTKNVVLNDDNVDATDFTKRPLRTNTTANDDDDVAILYTLTSVAHTPLGQYNSWKKAEERRLQVEKNPETEVAKLIPLFEQNILQFYPAFKQHFQYHSFFTSMKTKPYDATDSRECTVEREGRFVSIMSGKVNSLHVAEKEVLKILNENKSRRR